MPISLVVQGHHLRPQRVGQRNGVAQVENVARRMRVPTADGEAVAEAKADGKSTAPERVMKMAASSARGRSCSYSDVAEIVDNDMNVSIDHRASIAETTVKPRHSREIAASHRHAGRGPRVADDAAMTFSHVVDRVRSHFTEMPGLELTMPQAVRLLGFGVDDCRYVIDALVDAGFLKWTARRTIVRTGSMWVPEPEGSYVPVRRAGDCNRTVGRG